MKQSRQHTCFLSSISTAATEFLEDRVPFPVLGGIPVVQGTTEYGVEQGMAELGFVVFELGIGTDVKQKKKHLVEYYS